MINITAKYSFEAAKKNSMEGNAYSTNRGDVGVVLELLYFAGV